MPTAVGAATEGMPRHRGFLAFCRRFACAPHQYRDQRQRRTAGAARPLRRKTPSSIKWFDLQMGGCYPLAPTPAETSPARGITLRQYAQRRKAALRPLSPFSPAPQDLVKRRGGCRRLAG